MGYSRAGFDVYGVDLFDEYTRARYPFLAMKSDAFLALTLLQGGDWFEHPDYAPTWLTLDDFAVITASPPCQRYSITNAARRFNYPDLIRPTREALVRIGLPYVIENVVGSPLIDPFLLCGRQFDLTAVDDDGTKLYLDRHRMFESNVPLIAPASCWPHDPTRTRKRHATSAMEVTCLASRSSVNFSALTG